MCSCSSGAQFTKYLTIYRKTIIRSTYNSDLKRIVFIHRLQIISVTCHPTEVTFPPSIAMSVCLYSSITPELHVLSSRNFVCVCACVLPMAVARSSSDGVAIRYVVPVLWMTSYLNHVDHSYGGMSIPLQRVTSLHRRAQSSGLAVSYWLCRVIVETSTLCKGCWPSGAESATHHCLVYLLLLVLIKVSCSSVPCCPVLLLFC